MVSAKLTHIQATSANQHMPSTALNARDSYIDMTAMIAYVSIRTLTEG
jgi:hypothetical protein